ncbi:MAG: hypothetical protein AAF957_22175 [Planctomycetota bacterium]
MSTTARFHAPRSYLRPLSSAVAVLLLAAHSVAQECGVPETLEEADRTIFVKAVSGDGDTTVGELQRPSPSSTYDVRVWKVGSAPQTIALDGVAGAVSFDGGVVVGGYRNPAGSETHAFRWTAAGGLQDLGTLGGDFAVAQAVSSDGAVVVGTSTIPSGESRAFVWTASGGMQSLGPFLGGQTFATAVSADGSVIAGYHLGPSATSGHGFRWTSASGYGNLGGLAPNGRFWPTAMTSDGSVIVGLGSNGPLFGSPTIASRWTAATGIEDIGSDLSTTSFAIDVSDDGETVLINATIGPQTLPYRWHVSDGAVLVAAESSGTLIRWDGFSADANVLVGSTNGIRATAERLPLCWTGDPYCGPAVPNSAGRPGAARLVGSPVAVDNALSLTAYELPPSAIGYALVSRTQGFVFPVPASAGALCLGGSIGRLVGPGQVQVADAGGTFTIALDLTDLPTPTGPVFGLPGETWNFQVWHRDLSAAAPSNFTDAVSVVLQ